MTLTVHLAQAVAEAKLSEGQMAHINELIAAGDYGYAYAFYYMHCGTQVHNRFFELVDGDPWLKRYLSVAPPGVGRPDVMFRFGKLWWDVTTKLGWAGKVSKYKKKFGSNAVHLQYEVQCSFPPLGK
jgi:hypothetical protein